MEQKIYFGDELMGKKLRVVAYTRVSTKKDEQATSLETQKLFYQQFIESHENWEFCGIYSDSYTGTKLTRKGFSQMLLKCGIDVIKLDGEDMPVKIEGVPSQIDLIVIKNTSRFARHDMAKRLVKLLREKGVYVYFENLGKSTDDTSFDMTMGMLFEIDSNYSESLSRNIRMAYIRAIENRGTIFGSKLLFGYKKVGKGDKAELVPESQAHIDIINNIFKWYIEGKGFRVIAKMVDDQGFKSKKLRSDGTYAPIGKHGIQRILMNERYMGYVQVPIRTGQEPIGKIERKEGNYKLLKNPKITPIVSEELFNEAQKVLKKKQTSQRGKKTTSAKYSKYLICADCKCHFIKAQGHGGKTLYVCTHKRSEGVSVCQMPYISEQYLDEQLESLAANIFLGEIEEEREAIIERMELFKIGFIYDYLHNDNSEQLNTVREELDTLNRELNGMLKLIGKLDDDLVAKKSNEYYAQIKEKEELLEKYENTSSYLIDRIKICNAYIEQVKGYEIPKEITADTLLENVEYIYVYKLPNTTNRTQTKTNHVELDVSTRLQSQLEYLMYQFETSLEEWPSLALNVIDDMEQETKEALLAQSPT